MTFWIQVSYTEILRFIGMPMCERLFLLLRNSNKLSIFIHIKIFAFFLMEDWHFLFEFCHLSLIVFCNMPLSLNVKIFTKISDWSVVEMNFSMKVLLFLYKYVRTKKKKRTLYQLLSLPMTNQLDCLLVTANIFILQRSWNDLIKVYDYKHQSIMCKASQWLNSWNHFSHFLWWSFSARVLAVSCADGDSYSYMYKKNKIV